MMNIDKKLLAIGMAIDNAIGNIDKTKQELKVLEVFSTATLSDLELLYYHYIFGVALGNVRQHTTSPNDKVYNSSLIAHELYHLRFAEKIGNTLTTYSDEHINGIKSRIYTNLGNLYDHTGRFVEALKSWRFALQYTPSFSMAEFNIGFGLVNTMYYYDSEYYPFIAYISSEIVEKYKDDWQFKRNYPDIQNRLNDILKLLSKPMSNPNSEPLHLSESEEDKYRHWCISNCLYLNQYNDIDTQSKLSLSDNLFFQNILLPKNDMHKHEILINLFNQIKQEYVSARFQLYSYFCLSGTTHYSDNDVFLADLNNYSETSYNTELAKSSFRALYSILDKIAYFINVYFDLNVEEREVSFRKIWFSDKQCKHIKPKIKEADNFPLMGLFYIHKDLFCCDNKEFITSPEARMLRIIRNYMEHKCFILVDGSDDYYEEKDLTLYISRTLFEGKAFHLISLVRAAIIYLKNVITVAEYENHNAMKGQEGLIVDLHLNEIPQEYKV